MHTALDARRTWWEDGSFKKTAKKMMYTQLWRLGQWVSHEDAVQEAYVVFLIVLDKYPAAQTRQEVMGLFRRCLTNHLHKLARQGGADRVCVPLDACLSIPSTAYEELCVGVWLSLLPAEVGQLLQALLCADPKTLLFKRRGRLRGKRFRAFVQRETTAAYYQRLAQTVVPGVQEQLRSALHYRA